MVCDQTPIHRTPCGDGALLAMAKMKKQKIATVQGVRFDGTLQRFTWHMCDGENIRNVITPNPLHYYETHVTLLCASVGSNEWRKQSPRTAGLSLKKDLVEK